MDEFDPSREAMAGPVEGEAVAPAAANDAPRVRRRRRSSSSRERGGSSRPRRSGWKGGKASPLSVGLAIALGVSLAALGLAVVQLLGSNAALETMASKLRTERLARAQAERVAESLAVAATRQSGAVSPEPLRLKPAP